MAWVNHEGRWRAGLAALLAQLAARHDAIAALYANPNSSALSAAGVTLLYIGRYERASARAACPDAGPYPTVRELSYPGAG